MNNNNFHKRELLTLLAKSWNNLNISFVEKVLAKDVVYESQWVFQAIEGKSKVLAHLKLKFDAIRLASQSGVITVSAEMAIHPYQNHTHCIILSQLIPEGILEASVFISISNKLITRIDICAIPEPSKAILSGKFPS